MKNNWLVTPEPHKNADTRLFCFPFAGGSLHPYIQWIGYLPRNVELVIIQPPGRGVRILEDRYNEMAPLILDLQAAIRAKLDKPYAFFGHSLGSLIAFELMKKISEEGRPMPSHFFASASRSPQTASLNSAICYLPDNEFVAELKKLNGTPADILNDESLMSIYLPTIRSDIEIALRYKHENVTKFDCEVTILGGLHDFITEQGLAKWSENFRATESINMFNGGHFYINNYRDEIIKKISAVLGKPI